MESGILGRDCAAGFEEDDLRFGCGGIAAQREGTSDEIWGVIDEFVEEMGRLEDRFEIVRTARRGGMMNERMEWVYGGRGKGRLLTGVGGVLIVSVWSGDGGDGIDVMLRRGGSVVSRFDRGELERDGRIVVGSGRGGRESGGVDGWAIGETRMSERMRVGEGVGDRLGVCSRMSGLRMSELCVRRMIGPGLS